MARLGAAIEDVAFGWDNEFPAVESPVPAFSIDSMPVSNGEFLEFVEAAATGAASSGNRTTGLAGRAGLEHPWSGSGTGPLDVPHDLRRPPARAVGRLARLREPRRSARLRALAWPTAAHRGRVPPCRPRPPGWRRAGLSLGRCAPDGGARQLRLPALDADAPGLPSRRSQRLGDPRAGGQWLGVDGHRLRRLPGFHAYIPGYPGYSADFFDGKHFVLKGASWATDAALVRPSFRNWFQAHYPYVFAKFRCVGSPPGEMRGVPAKRRAGVWAGPPSGTR